MKNQSKTLAEVFAPLAPSRKQSGGELYRASIWAIDTFGKSLAREALPSDLTEENATKFRGWLKSAGYAVSTVNKGSRYLARVWRSLYANDPTCVERPPRDNRGRGKMRAVEAIDAIRPAPLPECANLTPSNGAFLADAFAEHNGKFAQRHRWLLERVIELFDRFAGRPTRVADLTPSNFDGFTLFLRKLYSDRTSENYRQRFRSAWASFVVANPAVASNPPPPYCKRQDHMPTGGRRRRREYPMPTDPGQLQRTIVKFFDTVYAPRKLLGKSQRTIYLYRLVFDRFADFLGRQPLLDDLTDATVCEFLRWRQSKGRSEHTVDKERDKVVAIANYAARKRHIPEFLDIPPLAPAIVSPQCWRIEQLQQLLKAARETPGKIGNTPAGIFWHAIITFAMYSGERTEATLSARWEWLTPDGWLRIPASVRKGRKKPANYKLPRVVLDEFEKLRPFTEATGTIFFIQQKGCWQNGPFYRHYDKLLKRAGLPTGRRWKLQCIRRTFATLLEANGGDATRALQHSSRKVTEESYIDETLIERKPPSAVIEEALCGKFAGIASAAVAVVDDGDLSLPTAELVA